MKLISCNIEGSKHLNRITELLRRELPDTVCFQEIYESDIPMLNEVLTMDYHFAPMVFHPQMESWKGTAIFSRNLEQPTHLSYAGKGHVSPSQEPVDAFEKSYQQTYFNLLTTSTIIAGETYVIGTVHMPVTRDGQVTKFQLEAVESLLEKLHQFPEIILCGDTNAPRGNEVFAKLSSVYRDNIPIKYQTSIDGDLHKAGQLPYMVDGLFTTAGYRAENVRLVSGVSDHCAVVADVYKN